MSVTEQLPAIGAATLAAIVSLTSTLYVTRATRRTNAQIEVLKSNLARDSADEQSRREYEYAARKRIYEQCEPLILKLAISCEMAADRITELADPRRWTELRATRDINSYWMLSRSSEVIASARALLEPLAYYTLLSEKVTLVDLNFDRRIGEIYKLSNAAYRVHLNDYKLAAMSPALPYDPIVEEWREKRSREPAAYWWQGLTRGRLDPAIELCIHREAGRITTLSEFETRYLELYDSPESNRTKSLGIFCNPLYNFTPADRPVYLRMLMCQLLIYRRISERSRLPAEVVMSTRFNFDRRDITKLQRSGKIADTLLDHSFDVALRYTSNLLADDQTS